MRPAYDLGTAAAAAMAAARAASLSLEDWGALAALESTAGERAAAVGDWDWDWERAKAGAGGGMATDAGMGTALTSS